jgi:hypothetical protein
MKKCLFGLLSTLILLALLQRPVLAGRPAASTWTPSDKLVAAYYFYWYNIYTGEHLITPNGSEYVTNHPPDDYLANFSYTEVNWHRRELLDMLAAGIDILLPVYFGNEASFFWSKTGLQNLVTAQQALIAEGRTPPKIGMFFDTNALLQQNDNIPPDLTTPTGKDHFYTMIFDFFTMVPPELWAMIDGRPILFLYSASIISAYDQSTFDYLNQHFQSDFGTTLYIVRDTSWQGVSTDGAYSWGSALYGPTVNGRVGTLGPGFDNTALANYLGQPPGIRPRACGEFYNSGWDAMQSGGANLVVIETWNELHEATEIAASREYGRKYIDLTAENIQRWKASDYGAAPFVWLDLGERPYRQGLQPAFNFPDGAWRVTRLAGREAAYPDATTTPNSHFIYLDVNNDFASAAAGEVWVTMEYFDGGTDEWSFQYDSLSNPYAQSEIVTLQNTAQWKRHTFHLTDAVFGGRQAGGADMRLTDNYWADGGQTNYFGRVWISKSAPGNQAPDLAGLNDVELMAGQVLEIPISATDPDGDPLALTLDREVSFASLTDNGDGTGVLHLAPTVSDLQPCPYPIRVIASDTGSPVLADGVSLRVKILAWDVYIPGVLR